MIDDHTYDGVIRESAERFLPYDWRVLRCQLWQESLFDVRAVSTAGARGIAQFMPETWREVCRELDYPSNAQPEDPYKAIPAAAHYMGKMYAAWHWPRPEVDRICLALASYNAGVGAVAQAQRAASMEVHYRFIAGHLPRETVTYVRKILGYFVEEVLG